MTLPVLDRRRISRELTRIANASVPEILDLLASSPAATKATRIGITGPPGVGKSSLIARLAGLRSESAGILAILPIDPSSPISGGAILGDRIRMEELTAHPNVLVRSLASRNSRNGLADNLPVMLEFLERSGFSELIIETVGVGQVEYDVRQLVDTVVLVLMPGTGDQVQAMKAGILESADIITVNKSDQPGAERMQQQLVSVIEARPRSAGDWKVPVIPASISDAASAARLGAAINDHQQWLARSSHHGSVRRERLHYQLVSLISRQIYAVVPEVLRSGADKSLPELYGEVLQKLARI